MAEAAETTKNTFDPNVVQFIVGKIEDCFTEIDSERGKYMQRCRTIRETISACYDEGAARGLPKKELRAFVAARLKLDKARKIIDELEGEQRETVEMLCEAYGDAADLPLFASHIDRVKERMDEIKARMASLAKDGKGDGKKPEARAH